MLSLDLPNSVVSADQLNDLNLNAVAVQGERVALIQAVRVRGILKVLHRSFRVSRAPLRTG